MALQKIKKGDIVIVIAGRDKNRNGEVLRVLGERVYVKDVRMVHKHVRPNPQAGENGGIKRIESWIHISNVAIYNPATKKADRVGVKLVDGAKKRYYKSNGEIIDV